MARTSRPPTVRRLLLGLVPAFLAGLSGCRGTQRVPEPMEPVRHLAEPGTENGVEALVVRHSDPVLIQRAGAVASFPMAFYRKRERVAPGGRVACGSGGRAELLWPSDASSIVLFDGGAIEIGDVAHDEPLVRFLDVAGARLVLTSDDRVELVGGAILRGDPKVESGPLTVERLGPELLRVSNRSKQGASVLFRDEVLTLRSGDSLDLPLLGGGDGPFPVDPDRIDLPAEGLALQVLGDVKPEVAPGRVHLVANESTQVTWSGLSVRLESGDQATFTALGVPRAETTP